jgi:hypothetical protein
LNYDKNGTTTETVNVPPKGRLQPRNGDTCQNNDNAQDFAFTGAFPQNHCTKEENPNKAGGSNAGQDRDFHMNQGNLIQCQGQEEQPIGNNDPWVQELPNKAFFLRWCLPAASRESGWR